MARSAMKSLILHVSFLYLFLPIFCGATDLQVPYIRMCVDSECSVPVSMGKTTLSYNSPDENVISFKENANVIVYAKSDGDLWEGEIGDQRGRFPKKFVRETKVLRRDLLPVSKTHTAMDSDLVLEGSSVTIATSDTVPTTATKELKSSTANTAIWFPENDDVTTATTAEHSEEPDGSQQVLDNRVIVDDSTGIASDDGVPDSSEMLPVDAATGAAVTDNVVRPTTVMPTTVKPTATKTSGGLLDGVFKYVEKGMTEFLKGRRKMAEDALRTALPQPVVQALKGEPEAGPPVPVVFSQNDVGDNETGVLQEEEEEEEEDEKPADVVNQTVVDASALLATAEDRSETVDNIDSFAFVDGVAGDPERQLDDEPAVTVSDSSVAEDDAASAITSDGGEVTSANANDKKSTDVDLHSPGLMEESKQDTMSTLQTELDPEEGIVQHMEDGLSPATDERGYFEGRESNEDLPNVTDVVYDNDVVHQVSSVNSSHVDSMDGHVTRQPKEEEVEGEGEGEDVEVANAASINDSMDVEGVQAVTSEPLAVADNFDDASVRASAFTEDPSHSVDATMEPQAVDNVGVIQPKDEHPRPPDNAAETGSCGMNSFEGNCPSAVLEEFFGGSIGTSEMPSEQPSSLVDLFRQSVQLILDYVPEPVYGFLCNLEAHAVSPRVVVFTVIVGVFVLIVQISIAAIKNGSKEHSLVTKLCDRDRLHLAVSKERDELKERLEAMTYNMKMMRTDSVGAQGTLHTLQSELDTAKGECCALRTSVADLEERLEEATQAGLELNCMLSDFLTSQSDGGRLREAIERVQEQLDAQRRRVVDLQAAYDAAASENLEYGSALQAQIELVGRFEAESTKNKGELLNLEGVIDGLRLDVAGHVDTIDTLRQENARLLGESKTWADGYEILRGQADAYEAKVKQLSESLETKSVEVDSLRNCVSKLRRVSRKEGEKNDDDEKGNDGGDDAGEVWRSLLDVAALKSELAVVLKEKGELETKLLSESEAKAKAEATSQRIHEEVAVLRREYDEANRKGDEAVKKLEILSGYFKEKEMQLQKELGVQEAVRQQNQENVASVHGKMNLLEQEVQLYKSQVGGLKIEIDSQERSYKNQIANQEKKAHENWLAARSAERRLDECKREAAVLRNKLTLLEKSNNESKTSHDQSKYGSNGEVGHHPSLSPPSSSSYLNPSDNRYDSSLDLQSSSGRSLYREPFDYGDRPFVPIERPLMPLPLPPPPPLPPFLRGLPLGPPLFPPPPPPPLLPPPPFDMDPGGPPDHWMRPPSPTSSSASSSLQRHGRYSEESHHRNRSPLHDGGDADSRERISFDRNALPGGRSVSQMQPPQMPRHHLRRTVLEQSDGRIDPRTSSPNTRVADDWTTPAV